MTTFAYRNEIMNMSMSMCMCMYIRFVELFSDSFSIQGKIQRTAS